MGRIVRFVAIDLPVFYDRLRTLTAELISPVARIATVLRKNQTEENSSWEAAALGAASALPALSGKELDASHKLVHHVFFWLKNPTSQEDLQMLLEGIRSLARIPTFKGLHVGVPAITEKRDVVDNTFSASEILFFDSVEGQDESFHSLLLRFRLSVE